MTTPFEIGAEVLFQPNLTKIDRNTGKLVDINSAILCSVIGITTTYTGKVFYDLAIKDGSYYMTESPIRAPEFTVFEDIFVDNPAKDEQAKIAEDQENSLYQTLKELREKYEKSPKPSPFIPDPVPFYPSYPYQPNRLGPWEVVGPGYYPPTVWCTVDEVPFYAEQKNSAKES